MAVLSDLSDEEAALLAIIQDSSGVDLGEFCFTDEGSPDGVFRCYDYQYQWYRAPDKFQIDQCVAGGSLVLTRRGYVPIEDVVVGDEVWTHRARWRPVTWRWDRGEQDVVLAKGFGHHGMRVTADHKFLTPVGTFEPLARGAYWALPMEVSDQGDIPSMSAAYASGRQNWVRDTSVPDFLWLYGLYLAEGSTSSSFGAGGRVNRTTFSVHESEVEYVTSVLGACDLRFNAHRVAQERCFNIVVNSQPLTDWMREHGGSGAAGKRVAPWLFAQEEKLRDAVLQGYLYGDGWEGADKQGNRRISFSTTSRELAYGMKLLAASLGYVGSTGLRQRSAVQIDGRDVTGRERYVVELRHGERQGLRIQDGFAWGFVRSVEPDGRARVYDLEVAEDHSFVVEGVAVHNCGRAVGKSMGMQLRCCAFPFNHPGEELLLTAPEMIHLDPVTRAVERRMTDVRMVREMLKASGKSNGITHRPFEATFRNGARIIGRIPQKDGRGVKGQHPLKLEIDEAQDYPEAGWIELGETLKFANDNAQWRVHGVSKGVRDRYYKYTQPTSGFFVHRITGMHRPDWTQAEREAKAEMYGSRDHPDYRRNILGLHGDASSSLFVLTRLMQCVDENKNSPYNDEYQHVRISDELLKDVGLPIEAVLDLPERHKNYERTWVGMDVGMTNHPSEILVFAEERSKLRGGAMEGQAPLTLKLILRVHLERISAPAQRACMEKIWDFYRPQAFAMDRTGLGLPIFSEIISGPNQGFARSLIGYNFAAKVTVGYDPYEDDVVFDDENPFGVPIEANVLEYSSDVLRRLVDEKAIKLPWDIDLVREFQGQTFVVAKAGTDAYGKRIFNKGKFHALDAARMAALAFQLDQVESAKQVVDYEPVLDSFLLPA